MARHDDVHPLVAVVVVLSSVGSTVLSLWITYVAFAGGTIPLLGWEVEGSVLWGVLTLMFGTPIITTLGYWAGLLVIVPFQALFGRR